MDTEKEKPETAEVKRPVAPDAGNLNQPANAPVTETLHPTRKRGAVSKGTR